MDMIRMRFLLVAAALSLVPTPAHATEVSVGPPFDSAWAYDGCLRVTPGDIAIPGCTSAATADVDGSVTIDVQTKSPIDGSVPGPSGGSAWSDLSLNHTLPTVRARFIVYTITLHVEHAEANAVAGSVGSRGRAYGGVWGAVDLESGGNSDGVDLVDSDGYSTEVLDDSDVALTIALGDGVRRSFGGRADVYMEVYGQADTSGISLNPQGGSARISIDAKVTNVTYEVIN